jgi:hypothetical protein
VPLKGAHKGVRFSGTADGADDRSPISRCISENARELARDLWRLGRTPPSSI